MKPNRDAYQRMLEILSNCESCANSLLETLSNEREALEAQDLQRINDIAGHKYALVERLDACEAQRMSLCLSTATTGLGDPAAASQMSDFLQEFDNSSRTLNQLWTAISVAIESCRTLNIANGAIIRLRQQHFESSLAILRGGDSGNGTYQRSGVSAADHASQSITEV